MSTSQIFFLRHFKTQSSLDNYLCGRSLLLPISESRDLSCSIPLDAAFCSSALRCRQTIEHVHFQNLASKIRYTDELLERNLGLMEGKPRDDMVQQFPNLFLDSKFRVFSTPLRENLLKTLKSARNPSGIITDPHIQVIS